MQALILIAALFCSISAQLTSLSYNAMLFTTSTCSGIPSQRQNLPFGICTYSPELNTYFFVTLLNPSNITPSGNLLTAAIGCIDSTCGLCDVSQNITQGQCLGGSLPATGQTGSIMAVLNITPLVPSPPSSTPSAVTPTTVAPVTVIVPPVSVQIPVSVPPATVSVPTATPRSVVVQVSSASNACVGIFWISLAAWALL